MDCMVWNVYFLYCFRFISAEKIVWTGLDTCLCFYGSIFCVAESYEKGLAVAVLQKCCEMVICHYGSDFIFVSSFV